jgi:hypothetical protein
MKESKQAATSKKGTKTAGRAAPKKSQAAEGVPAKDETASVTPEERYRMIAEAAYPKCSISEIMTRLCCFLQAVELGICEGHLTGFDLCQQCCQFGAVKLPLKRHWALMGRDWSKMPSSSLHFEMHHMARETLFT